MTKKTVRSFVAGTVAILSFLVLVLTLLFIVPSFEGPRLAQQVRQRARETAGIELETSSARFEILEGLVLEGVEASSRSAIGRYRARIDEVRLPYDFRSLWTGKISVDGLRLVRPRIDVVVQIGGGAAADGGHPDAGAGAAAPSRRSSERPAAATEPQRANGASDPSGLAPFELVLAPRSIHVEDGSVSIRDDGRDRDVSLDGLAVDLSPFAYDRRAVSPVHGMEAKGLVAAASFSLGALRIGDLSGSLDSRAGRLRFDGLRFRTERGELEGLVELDFNSIPFRYKVSLMSASFDLARLVGATEGQWEARARVRFEGEGFGSESRHLRGKGRLELPAGRFPALAWVARIDPALPGIACVDTEVAFEVNDGLVTFEKWTLASVDSESEMTLSGSVGLDDSLDTNVDVRLGARRASYRLRGTLGRPELSRRDGSAGSRSARPEGRRER